MSKTDIAENNLHKTGYWKHYDIKEQWKVQKNN